jgi:hypothetical protein
MATKRANLAQCLRRKQFELGIQRRHCATSPKLDSPALWGASLRLHATLNLQIVYRKDNLTLSN